VNFAREYREQVFDHFLAEHAQGRTPNPDVLCNREIKFGVMRRYAQRLGAARLATGHYARVVDVDGRRELHKAADTAKDQSYFLCAVAEQDLADTLFPLGELAKSEVRAIAHTAGLAVAAKKDSTGICFIGERPFAQFLSRYLPDTPGVIRDDSGRERGIHRGLSFYTLGQRHGIGIGGRPDATEQPWYVARKDAPRNELIVVQGNDHPWLFQNRLAARSIHWINGAPRAWVQGGVLRCTAKIRYRQADETCSVLRVGDDSLEVAFDRPQRTPAPGQYVVLYDGSRCLGGAVIEYAETRATALCAAV
jgi:tRNA-specific 2-thiouridylase